MQYTKHTNKNFLNIIVDTLSSDEKALTIDMIYREHKDCDMIFIDYKDEIEAFSSRFDAVKCIIQMEDGND